MSETFEDWHKWFAWHPVTLLTAESAWLRPVMRRRQDGYNSLWKPSRKWAYANSI